MKTITDGRGFRAIEHIKYASKPETQERLLQESSAISDDSYDLPGSSYLWVGSDHHLNREEITALIKTLEFWLDGKRLPELD